MAGTLVLARLAADPTAPSAGFGNIYLKGASDAAIQAYFQRPDATVLQLANLNEAQTFALLQTFTLGLKSSIGISVGGATVGAGGIAFPATAVSVADANTLDDYEEGNWTAAFASTGGSITIDSSNNTMSYTKCGRMVTVTGDALVSSVSSPTGTLRITGLPFTNRAGTQLSAYTAILIYADGLEATAATVMQGYIAPSTTAILIAHFAAGTSANAAADVKAGSQFMINCTYFI